jgi:hypothetical protein
MPRIAGVLFLAVACSGCLKSTTVISVRPDGTGTILQETGLSPEALAMLKGFAGAAGEQKGGAPPEIFGEEQAKKAASTMGVRFISGEPIKTAELEGYRARFAFDDVRKLQMKMNQNPVGDLGDGGKAGAPFGFGFDRRGDSATLTITMPQENPTAALEKMTPGLGSAAGASPEANQQALEMMKAMMKGMFVDVSLEIDGRIVKTNAPHVDGRRVTLMQVDFDKLLASAEAFKQLQGASDLKSLSAIPGLKMITEPKVTVEFVR